MKTRYVSLEEAHPPLVSMFNVAIRNAMIQAYRKAIKSGKRVPPVPECARKQILASKSRHSFSD